MISSLSHDVISSIKLKKISSFKDSHQISQVKYYSHMEETILFIR